jgi:alpha-glucosidase
MSTPLKPQAEVLKLWQESLKVDATANSHPFWDRDDVLDIYREWRTVFDEYDPPLT